MKAPWVKMFFYGDYDTYIIPGIDYVTLGGCRQYDSFKQEVDKYDSASIWERCVELLPNLKSAEVIKEVAGLRPHRTPVRVEREVIVTSGGKHLQVFKLKKFAAVCVLIPECFNLPRLFINMAMVDME